MHSQGNIESHLYMRAYAHTHKKGGENKEENGKEKEKQKKIKHAYNLGNQYVI